MERKEVLRKNINSMFLVKELYDITTFEGMADTYSKNMSRVWIELAMILSNIKNTGLNDTELEILEVFKNTKYTDTEKIIDNITKLKKRKFDIINLVCV